MDRKIRILTLLLAWGLILLALTGCDRIPGATSTATLPAAGLEDNEVPLVQGDPAVVVEGRLVPGQDATLSFNLGGVVTALLAAEGEPVETGQVIARLDQAERLAAAVSQAELEVVVARQALDDLDKNAEVITAAAAQRVASARDAVRAAERYRDNLLAGGRGTDIDQASANVILLRDRLKQAREDYAPYENKPEDNLTRAQLLSRLADAQRRYDDAVRLLNNLEGSASDIDLAIAEANLSLAQADLALAEQEYADVQDGPNPDDVEVAQARLAAAESALQAAQASLDDAELVAPFSGTIVQLNLNLGEQAIPGQPAAVLANLSDWIVETEDLNEMELPRVAVGQAVEVTPDALPELTLSGEVISISQLFQERYGDITYTAKISLAESDPRLRWGLTVSVRFVPED